MSRLRKLQGTVLPDLAAEMASTPGLVLSGVTINERYVERSEKDQLLAKQQGLGLLLMLGSYIVFYFGACSIRRTMLEHYNKVEPMQLKLSAAMVFSFSCFYLQHHMTRFARWKAGGILAS